MITCPNDPAHDRFTQEILIHDTADMELDKNGDSVQIFHVTCGDIERIGDITCKLCGAVCTDSDINPVPQKYPNAEALKEAHGGHWGKIPEHPVETWQLEVENHETRQGYWEWAWDRLVNSQEDSDDSD